MRLRQIGFATTCLLLLLRVVPLLAKDATNSLRAWDEYRTIMWIGDTAYRSPEKLPLFFQRLREMGINTAMVYGDGDPKPLLDNHVTYYVENMVNRGLCLKFNSSVHDWDKFVTDWAKNGRVDSARVRDYCLDDPVWLASASRAVQQIVSRNRANLPLAYNIRDELSTTISANPFDYDFNPLALEAFRKWLQAQYESLNDLNSEWDTDFSTWSAVRPFTTDQIKNRMISGDSMPRGQPDWQKLQQTHFDYPASLRDRKRWNFSPWADFRTYMDVSLARTLGELRKAARELDPHTPVGIEGTQMPHAFGGYDLWRLSQVLDWVEPYDVTGSREIFGSFMPGQLIMTTVFESDDQLAARRLWHLLLEGDRGCIVWWSEDCVDWHNPQWALTAKAKNLQPVLQEMTSPLAQLFLSARPERDPIFIHYSQMSIQVDWLMESTVDGSTWLRRFSSYEAQHNQLAKTRVAWLKALQDLGYSPQFVASEQLEGGRLNGVISNVLVLADSWALSDKELAEINKPGLKLLVEGPAGVFDQHGKLRDQNSAAAALAPQETSFVCRALRASHVLSTISSKSRDYLAQRLNSVSPWFAWLKTALQDQPPPITVPPNAQIRIHRFQIPEGRLIAFERNINYQMSEDLKQAGGNQALELPLTTETRFEPPAHVYDLRGSTYLGLTNRIAFVLDPWRPSLFALLRQKPNTDAVLEHLLQQSKR